MSFIAVGNINTVGTNPTNYYLPVKTGNVFLDSLLLQNDAASILQTNGFGFELNNVDKAIYLGDWDSGGNGSKISIDDTNLTGEIFVNGHLTLNVGNSGYLEIAGTGVSSGAAGGASGDHLVITVNGNQYKIALLNP